MASLHSKSVRLFLLMAAVTLLALTQPVAAASIALFNTGVDGAGTPITPFASGADSHYTLEGPDFLLGPANVINKHPAWVGAPAGSQWIGRAEGSAGNTPSAIYTFTTTFDLTGLDIQSANITGEVAADDVVTIALNGVITHMNLASFQSLAPFSLDDGFVTGINTLQFGVLNSDFAGINPMGLVVADLAGTAAVVPIPAALPLLLSGLLGSGMLAGRRRRAI